MALSNPFICLPIASNHHSFCIYLYVNYPISLHKTSSLYNACYHSNYCIPWTKLNNINIAYWTHWRTLLCTCNVNIASCWFKILNLNQNILQWFASIITQFDIIYKWLSLLKIQYNLPGKFINNSVLHIYIDMNIEIKTLSSEYHVFIPH